MGKLLKPLASIALAILITAGAFAAVVTFTQPPPKGPPSNEVQLTQGQGSHIEPMFSPTGKQIVFSSNQSGTFEIWLATSDGRQQTRLTWMPGDQISPSWSPDGTRVAFISENPSHSDLCVATIGSGETGCVTKGAEVESFAWSPDGGTVAYGVSNGTIRFITLATRADFVFPFNDTAGDPAYGPDPNVLYFSAGTGDQRFIWRADINGSDAERLSFLGNDVMPQVSPTGSSLMYLTNLTGHYEPWLIDLSTGINRYLLNRPDFSVSYTFPPSPPLAANTLPSWGPNGSRILFVSSQNGSVGDLYLVTLNFPVDFTAANPPTYGINQPGTFYELNVYNKVPVGSSIHGAWWSPDGKAVLLEAYVAGNSQLFLLRSGPPVRASYGG